MRVPKMNKIIKINKFWGCELIIVSDLMLNTHFERSLWNQLALLFDCSYCIGETIFLQVSFRFDFILSLFIIRIHLLLIILDLLLFFLFPLYSDVSQDKLWVTNKWFIIILINKRLIENIKFRKRLEIKIWSSNF